MPYAMPVPQQHALQLAREQRLLAVEGLAERVTGTLLRHDLCNPIAHTHPHPHARRSLAVRLPLREAQPCEQHRLHEVEDQGKHRRGQQDRADVGPGQRVHQDAAPGEHGDDCHVEQ